MLKSFRQLNLTGTMVLVTYIEYDSLSALASVKLLAPDISASIPGGKEFQIRFPRYNAILCSPFQISDRKAARCRDLYLHKESHGEACQLDFSMLNGADPINQRFTKTDPDLQTR
jgi:hypothetical protein